VRVDAAVGMALAEQEIDSAALIQTSTSQFVTAQSAKFMLIRLRPSSGKAFCKAMHGIAKDQSSLFIILNMKPLCLYVFVDPALP
jgi:hypothetical protein